MSECSTTFGFSARLHGFSSFAHPRLIANSKIECSSPRQLLTVFGERPSLRQSATNCSTTSRVTFASARSPRRGSICAAKLLR